MDIFDLKNVGGDPRFYPLENHPATYRMRVMRDRLIDLPPSPARDEALDYVMRQLDDFNAGEMLGQTLVQRMLDAREAEP